MRHGKRINHLGRTASHRKAMLSNMATSLIQNKRIVTTVAKAKALRQYVEPLITKSKTDTTHSRRMVFRYLQDKESVNILFDEVSDRVADRAGGYTRILKTGNRLGDNASMCIIELVDYNESLLKEATPKRSKTRRSRRGKGAAPAAAAVAATEVAEAEVVADAVAEEISEEEVVASEEAVAASEEVEEAASVAEEEASAEAQAVEAEEPSSEADVVEEEASVEAVEETQESNEETPVAESEVEEKTETASEEEE